MQWFIIIKSLKHRILWMMSLRVNGKNVDAVFVRGAASFYSRHFDKALDHFKQTLTSVLDYNHSMIHHPYLKRIILKQKNEEAWRGFQSLGKRQSQGSVSSRARQHFNQHYFNVSVCYGNSMNTKLSPVYCYDWFIRGSKRLPWKESGEGTHFLH